MVSRTNFELNCIVGLPGSRWRGEAFAVEPFQLPAGYLARLAGPSEAISSNGSKPRHPMYYAQVWSKELADTPGLTITQVAEREGFARKRLNSILRLLRFPSDVQSTLSSLSDPDEIDFYRERRLRHLIYLGEKEQRAGFAKLRQRWAAQSQRSKSK